MGVIKLASWIINNCNESIIQVEFKDNGNVPSMDCYALDMNAIIHGVRGELDSIIGSSQSKPTQKEYEKRLIIEVGNNIIKLLKFINPKKYVLLYIDGVAGMAKSKQQRERRFNAAKLMEQGINIFDSNAISVGTEFMKDMSQYIRDEVIARIKKEINKSLEIEFSSDLEAGEGEHKIVRRIEKLIKQKLIVSCGINSVDADLFLLSLVLMANVNDNNVKYYLSRKEQNPKYHLIIDMNILSSFILNKINSKEKSHLLDFVAVASFLGNDFLPISPTLDIASLGMDNLLKTTSYVLKDKGAIVYISNDGFYGLKWNSLVYMLKGLAEIEKQGLLDKKINLDRMSPAHQDLCLNKCISNDNIDLEEYKKCYYKKFNVGDLEHTIRNVCKEYMIGVLFVLNYYILGIPSWNWFYKYHRSPFFSDIYSFFENKKHKAEGIISSNGRNERILSRKF